MATAAKEFDPGVNERCDLFGETYVVQPHPASPTRRYAQVGGRGRVFQLRHQGDRRLWALKVFHNKFRASDLLSTAHQLALIEGYEGLHAAKRRIILPSDPVVGVYPNLEYAIMMPWIHGKTWYDFLVEAGKSGLQLSTATSLRLCRRFLEVVNGLEESGMAHTDLAPGNLVFEPGSCDVQLLDLEDMYMPAARGMKLAKGSKGYRHPSGDVSGEHFWRAEGDRYAAAVLAAEILILSNREFARLATDEGFFSDHRLSMQAATRYGEAKAWLSKVAPTFAAVFERAWMSNTIGECPRVSDLYAAAREAADNAPQPYQSDVNGSARNTPVYDFARWRPHTPVTTRATPATQDVWKPLPPPPARVPAPPPRRVSAPPPTRVPAPPPAPSFTPPTIPAVRPSPVPDSLAVIAVAVGVGGAVVGLVVFLVWLLLTLL